MRLLVLLGFLATPGWGCSCMVSPTTVPPCQYAWSASAVFTGTVEEITEPELPGAAPFSRRKVRIRITEVLTGLDPAQPEIVVETGMGSGDCGYGFQRGFDYIVYAGRKPDGAYTTGICTLTRPLEKAAEDLKYFHSLARAPSTAEIRVTAWDVHGPRLLQGDGPPQLPVLAGAQVTLDGPGVHQSATTDAAGRHIFSGLPPGEYTVDASLEGYAGTRDQIRPIPLQAKGCFEVPLPLQLNRKVSGRILTQDGQPLSGVTVEAVPTRPRSENDLPWAADSSTTDGEGRYEMRHLSTGDYYIGISLSHPPTLQHPYTRWFYPGTEDPAAAAILHVSDHPEALRFDLTLPPPQHDRVIRGTVFWPDGRPAEGVHILLEDPRWPWLTSTIAETTDREGRFAVHALDGTRYRLHAAAPLPYPVSAEPAPIDPGGSPLNLKLVLTRQGYYPIDGVGKGLEDWRKGLGLR